MSGKIQKLFEEQDVNISQMSRKTGIPYGTLYDIAIGKTSFDKIKIGALSKIAHEFGMTVDEFGMTVDELIGDVELDPDRYELCQIYDALGPTGRVALIACARGLSDAFAGEIEDVLNQSRYEDELNG